VWTAWTGDDEGDWEPATRVEVDGQAFDVAARRDRAGHYRFDWVSGPNPGYGFSSARSDGQPFSDADIEQSIRDFLAMVDPETGYIE
jgi:pimeloyl-ACP methyl ester carboxylesterase